MRYAVQSGLIDYNPAQEMAGAVASGNRKHRPALELKRIPELLQKIDGYTGRPLTRWATELTLLILFDPVNYVLLVGRRLILKRQCGRFHQRETYP
jgi:integrase